MGDAAPPLIRSTDRRKTSCRPPRRPGQKRRFAGVDELLRREFRTRSQAELQRARSFARLTSFGPGWRRTAYSRGCARPDGENAAQFPALANALVHGTACPSNSSTSP